MENEYIRLEAAEQIICEACERPGCPRLWGNDCDRIDRLNSIPTADVRPVKIGHYVTDEMGDSSCSECGEKYLDITKRFCPECGAELRRSADMREATP